MVTLGRPSRLDDLEYEIKELKNEIKTLTNDFEKKIIEYTNDIKELKEIISISNSDKCLYEYAKKYLLRNYSKLEHTLKESPNDWEKRMESYSFKELTVEQREVASGFNTLTSDFFASSPLDTLSGKPSKVWYNTSFIYHAEYQGFKLNEYNAKQLFELIKDMEKSA